MRWFHLTVRITIVRPNIEVVVLANKIAFAHQLPHYSELSSPSSNLRSLPAKAVSQQAATAATVAGRLRQGSGRARLRPSPSEVVSISPSLPSSAEDALLEKAIYALTAIGDMRNPPAHHIAEHDGVASVKEKLKTVARGNVRILRRAVRQWIFSRER
jgi:hypothetical protein